jgi:hypothetical protein
MKSRLSTLWIFATLNYLYCDVVGLMDPNLLKGSLAGNVGGTAVSPGLLLGVDACRDPDLDGRALVFSRLPRQSLGERRRGCRGRRTPDPKRLISITNGPEMRFASRV